MTDEPISEAEIKELNELFGGQFPPDYVQLPLDLEVETWLAHLEAAGRATLEEAAFGKW